MASTGGMSSDDVVNVLETLRNQAVESRNALASIYESLPEGDPRRVTARHIKAVLSSAYLSAWHWHENMTRPTWWVSSFGYMPPAVKDEIEDYGTLLVSSVVVFPLGLFESALRRIVRTIDSAACAGGNAEFNSIYRWLFARLHKDGWSYIRGNPTEFLDLARTLRNTIHNNGCFRPPNGKDRTITWDGKTYLFEVGRIPSFVDWEFHLASLNELITLNHATMTAPLISSLPPIR